MAAPQLKHTVERERQALNGWLALVLVVLWFIAAVAVFVSTGAAADEDAFRQRLPALRIWAAPLHDRRSAYSCASASSRCSRTRRAC